MQAIVNIELDAKVNPDADVNSRFAAVMGAIRRVFTRSVGEIRTASYEGPDGLALEFTAVITFEHHCDKNIVLNAMGHLARQFNQDCVAVLFGDGEGRLVGPEADRWGGFKIQYFKRPAIYGLLQEAA